MKILWAFYVLVILLSVAEAKKKRIDADFEFIDKVTYINMFSANFCYNNCVMCMCILVSVNYGAWAPQTSAKCFVEHQKSACKINGYCISMEHDHLQKSFGETN